MSSPLESRALKTKKSQGHHGIKGAAIGQKCGGLNLTIIFICIMWFDIAFVMISTLAEISNRRDPEGTKSDPQQTTSSYTKTLELLDTSSESNRPFQDTQSTF